MATPLQLAHDSFFRRLPMGLDAKQRFYLEALALAVDGMSSARLAIEETAVRYGMEIDDLSEKDHLSLISAAWMIIDRIDAVRQLLAHVPVDQSSPALQRFAALSEQAREMRNCMDHLGGLPNRKRKPKESNGPLFGTLTYIYTPPADPGAPPPTRLHGKVVAIPAGEFKGDFEFQMPNPAGQRVEAPVGLLALDAFGERWEIDPPLRELSSILAAVGPALEREYMSAALAHSAESGAKIEDLMSGAISFRVICADYEQATGG